jgi:hypothetical protein
MQLRLECPKAAQMQFIPNQDNLSTGFVVDPRSSKRLVRVNLRSDFHASAGGRTLAEWTMIRAYLNKNPDVLKRIPQNEHRAHLNQLMEGKHGVQSPHQPKRARAEAAKETLIARSRREAAAATKVPAVEPSMSEDMSQTLRSISFGGVPADTLPRSEVTSAPPKPPRRPAQKTSAENPMEGASEAVEWSADDEERELREWRERRGLNGQAGRLESK